jgi:hypothetical protein
MSTLEKLSLSIPAQLLDNSERLSDIENILGEVVEFGERTKEMSFEIKHTASKLKGTSGRAPGINAMS